MKSFDKEEKLLNDNLILICCFELFILIQFNAFWGDRRRKALSNRRIVWRRMETMCELAEERLHVKCPSFRRIRRSKISISESLIAILSEGDLSKGF